MVVKKYKVYCNTELIHVDVWSETQPTTCPNNNTHTIDDNKTAIIDIVLNEVTIKQTHQNGEPQDHYRLFTYYATVGPNEIKEIDLRNLIDVNMFAVDIITSDNSIGDTYDVHVDKNTLIGGITQSSNTKILNVSQTVIQYSKIGFYISVNQINQYMITDIDIVNNTIEIECDIITTIGDPVYLTYFMIKDRKITFTGTYPMGSSIIGSARILKTQKGAITYMNNSSSTKKIIVNIETTF